MRKGKCCFVLIFLLAGSVQATPEAEEIVYDAGKRRDPFDRQTVQVGAAASVGTIGGPLEGIIYDPQKKSLAILGGKTYVAGDKVGDATIKEIQKDGIVILVDGEEKVLRLRDEEKNR